MKEDQNNFNPSDHNDPNQFGEWGAYEIREGFGVRFGAFLIDAFIYMVLWTVIAFPLGIIDFYSGLDFTILSDPNFAISYEFQHIAFLTSLISSAILIVYMIMDAFLAATPGKLILNRRNARDDRYKGDVNILSKRALIKWGFIFLTLLSLLPALSFLGYIASLYQIIIFFGAFAILSQKKQALHDILAKTAVYHKDDIID